MSVAVWEAVQRTKQLQEVQEDIMNILNEQVFKMMSQEEQGSFRQYLMGLKEGTHLKNETNASPGFWAPDSAVL
jgi:hypothetical protein